MNKPEIKQFIIDHLNERFSISIDDLKNEGLTISHGLNMDSLDVVELVMEIEDNFEIQIPDTTAESWDKKTIDQIANEVLSIWEQANVCQNCGGTGFVEQSNCSKPASECCGGCFMDVPCIECNN